MPYVPPSGFRIRRGETVLGLVWSNTSVTLGGSWRVIYDDGTPDMLSFNATASGSARATVVVPTQWIARKDGYVVEGAVIFEGTGPAQRGQTYIQVVIVTDDLAIPSTRQVIAAGYVYAGHAPTLGEIVEPGPAGGHGMLKNARTASTAIGTGLADAAPTGAIWRVRSARYLYTASAGAGSRVIVALPRDASGNEFLSVQTLTLTATQAGLYELMESHQDSTATHRGAVSPNAQTLEPLPANWLMFAGFDLFIKDLAGIDVADTVVREIHVEEWVMPN